MRPRIRLPMRVGRAPVAAAGTAQRRPGRGTRALTGCVVVGFVLFCLSVPDLPSAAGGLPLLLVLVRPVLAWVASAGAALVFAALLPWTDAGGPPLPAAHGVVLLALLLAVCVRESVPVALACAAASAGLFAWALPADPANDWTVSVGAVTVVGLLVGGLVRQTRRGRQEKARRIVLEERARIARDLHDVVAHHMSLVVVRTETAAYRVEGLSAGAREELGSIGDTARAALAETRSLLAVLRQDHDRPEHEPQPGLDRLDELISATRRAGVPLTADVGGELADLRPGTSMAAFRIVQEALANAARHAPGAAVRLRVHRDGDALRLRVENTCSGVPRAAGHGITGMRERARAEDGQLVTTCTGDRFAVEAVLPTRAPR